MNFLRIVLKLPVPEVLAHSTSSDNPIGAEYILMERVKGESLSSRWLSLTTDELKDIMTQIADMERKISDFHFPAYGSLYHKKDLDGETQVPIVEDFCIGPVSARQFWHGQRSKTEIDRGPCTLLPFPLPSLFFVFRTITPMTGTDHCQGFHSWTVLRPRLAERWLSFSITPELSLARHSFYRPTTTFVPPSIPRYFRDSYNWHLI